MLIFVIFEISGGITDGEAHFKSVTQPTARIFEVHEGTEIPKCPDMPFTREDGKGISFSHSDPLFMVVEISERPVYKVLVDTEAKVNVINKSCWDMMDVKSQHLVRATTPIVGFSGESMRSEGKVTLSVTIEDQKGVAITCR